MKIKLKYNYLKGLDKFKPILGQHGIPFKIVENDFKNLVNNLPYWDINVTIKVISKFNKKIKINIKNFDINFFIKQYIIWKKKTNKIFNYNDIYILFFNYIKLNKLLLNYKLNYISFFFIFLGILKSCNYEIKKNIFKK